MFIAHITKLAKIVAAGKHVEESAVVTGQISKGRILASEKCWQKNALGVELSAKAIKLV